MSEIKRKSFVLHHDSLELVYEDFSNEQAGMLLKALYRFDAFGEMPEFEDSTLKFAFKSFMKQFLRDREKYEKQVLRNRENGAKGGRPKK